MILKTIRDPKEGLGENEWIMDPGIVLWNGDLPGKDVANIIHKGDFDQRASESFARLDIYNTPVMLIDACRDHYYNSFLLRIIVEDKVCWVESRNIAGIYGGTAQVTKR